MRTALKKNYHLTGRIATVLLLILFIFPSCSRKSVKDSSNEIELPSTPLFSNSNSWAVANDLYVRIYKDKYDPEKIVKTCRKGDVLEILRREIITDQRDNWLKVRSGEEEGWVKQSKILIFDNRSQAETSSSNMQKKGS